MDALLISGPANLSGTVRISGSKNTALPFLFSSLLLDSRVTFTEVPRLWDVETTLQLLQSIGTESSWNKEAGQVELFPKILKAEADYALVKKMRAGILALGPLLAKHGTARVSLPGGCAIGARPVNFHLAALEKMGATIEVNNGYIEARTSGGLRGAEISFPQVSVTGTENVLMAAVLAKGTTVIRNAAREPEVTALAQFLVQCGAQIEGLGSETLEVVGGALTPPREAVPIPPDRIEAGTWMAVSAITRCPLTLENIDVKTLQSTVDVFAAMGVTISAARENAIQVRPPKNLSAISVRTDPYPGFATDMQAQILAVLCTADGTSEVEESIFENRFMHVAELNRLGAEIEILGHKVKIRGRRQLKAAPLMATDLRASASLVVAALAAEGQTRVSRIYHLDRGYQKLDQKLALIGAKITRVSES